MSVVEVRDLDKCFRGGILGTRLKVALHKVNLTVQAGMIYGILGPNGAGKTTLLSILATLLLPDRGSVRVLGMDVRREASLIRARINMASGNANFPWSLTVPEVLTFYAMLYGLWGKKCQARVHEAMEICELTQYATIPYNELSTGLKQRLALAKALVNHPQLLLLDEPTMGLDPDVSVRIRQQIAGLRSKRGTTILLSTHYMPEAEALCDEIAFLRSGEILATGTPIEVKRRVRFAEVIRVRGSGTFPLDAVERLPGVKAVHGNGDGFEIRVDEGRQRLDQVIRCLHQAGFVLQDVGVQELNLEEVFLELVR
ncbi:MAG: ABC transporter ATP-binding protein [Acidobacteria bacterium]|nr:ABC transporter ATP-binding protein [Acidobacteriota bacterium]